MKIIYVDLDGVVADFDRGKMEHPLGSVSPYIGRPDKLPGIYKDLRSIKDSIESVNKILSDSRYILYPLLHGIILMHTLINGCGCLSILTKGKSGRN